MDTGKADLSFARKFSLWFFRPPFSPYVSLSVSADFTRARAYLAEVNEDGGPRVSVQHLMVAAIGRVYAEFPVANATASATRIQRFDHVGVAMPVNLLDGPARRAETSLVILERAEERSLTEIAGQTRRRVAGEKSGRSDNALLRFAHRLAEKAPTPLLGLGLSALDRLGRLPGVANRLHARFPITVVVSNPGAALPLPQGAIMGGAAFSPPQRLMGVGSLVGVFPIQDEVVPVDGQPQVRPMLPLLYVFDHRLFDGVLAGRILTRLFEVLQEPELHFGPRGRRSGP